MENNTTELVPSEYGLEEKQAKEITVGLSTVKKEREALIESFENVIQEEISEENIPMFKALRLQIRDNRTKGIETWHKTNKAYFWNGGKFVDSIRNKEVLVNQRMEDALITCEKHYELEEEKRLKELQSEREGLISEFLFEGEEHREYAKMDDELWNAIYESKKKAHIDFLAAELEAEKERVAKVKQEKEDALKAKTESGQAELKKGDSDKVQDLKSDLEELKTKYSFKSAKYKKTYSDVNILIDKVINHINQ
jgi:hypothetical protein